jgi:cellulose 1,4-beta-cellobiosidase
MLWLDSLYPTDAPPERPGVARGTCDTSSGVPSVVEEEYPDSHVIFSNIKVGPIGSTFGSGSNNGGGGDNDGGNNDGGNNDGGNNDGGNNGGGGGGVAQQWAQCGGSGWTGPTQCASPYTCTEVNEWYYQCQ